MTVENEASIQETLCQVYDALAEKGYPPIEQITGFLLSEDPTYITPSRDARRKITRFDSIEILVEVLKDYFRHRGR